ncbi:hypothetical protein [Halomarina ordinaria]|uniref:CHAT domain-containing protein n=1 Tax=Halomarina ordinaria TaxID=3033939 RepID=A0ABD5U5L2_9EURY|nr:hypothetical protein [Halomarina sp. PSRA2]
MTFVTVEPDEASGVVVVDRIERRRCRLRTAGAVDPRACPAERLPLPVDAAATVTTRELTLGQSVDTYVRDTDGALVFPVAHFEERRLPAGEVVVELNASIKCYLSLRGPGTVTVGAGETTVRLEHEGEVVVGARSYHERPAATVTTTADPDDVFAALSTLGSALKTTTCERSFPTLRGHPPAIELGEALSIPDGLEPPDTGVTLELPPTLEAGLVAAPLAYYLGARVEVGDAHAPRIRTETGFSYPLDGPDGYERTVERVLRHVFLLDCLVRTEGFYPVDLAERRTLEGRASLDLEFAALYDAPLAEQLEAYLAVPFEALDAVAPTWKQTAHVEAVPASLETLPFLVADLAVVRTPAGHTPVAGAANTESLEAFMRGAATRGASTHGPVRATETATSTPDLVRPAPTDSLESVWVGPEAPVGASKASVAAFRNRLDQQPKEGDIRVAVVCNDETMLEEHAGARGAYGARDDLPYAVSLYRDLTTDRLRLLLESDVDYFHYIGHIDDDGFRCADGYLDATTVDSVGVDAFFLNACSSYRQGMALIEAGAIGGVATLDPVVSTGATTVGRTMARLLNGGFTLRAALAVAREESMVGGQYLVVGDGNVDIAQPESGVPMVCEVESVGDRYEMTVRTFPTDSMGMGTLFSLALPGYETRSLVPNSTPTFSLTRKEFEWYLALDDAPVRIDGELTFSSDFLED